MANPCGEKTEVYSRVVGYYRPVTNWNKGKQEEFELRKTFSIEKSLESSKNVVKKERPLLAVDE